jgi:hypothetical protein
MIRCAVGTQVQSMLFSRVQWTRARARAWLRKHEMRYDKIDATAHYFRFRQKQTARFDRESFRIITLSRGLGIRAVIACPK